MILYPAFIFHLIRRAHVFVSNIYALIVLFKSFILNRFGTRAVIVRYLN